MIERLHRLRVSFALFDCSELRQLLEGLEEEKQDLMVSAFVPRWTLELTERTH